MALLICLFIKDDYKDKIESNKDFILRNATYKCTKTNELIDGK